jgi:pheromone shutdown protein TraB
MARTLIALHRRGERVFAVVGSGHVVRIEWILRKTFGSPPAPDQPETADAPASSKRT